jgi:hypothetical protein
MVNIANKSHAVTAEIQVPASGAEGGIAAMGGNTRGWSLYARDGKPKYCYNFCTRGNLISLTGGAPATDRGLAFPSESGDTSSRSR